MHLSGGRGASSQSNSHRSGGQGPSRLPKRFPVGTTYVVEGCGGENGELRIFSRYLVLPGGQRINLAEDFAGPAAPRARSRSLSRSKNQGQISGKRRSARAKKIMAGGGTSRQHRR